ncbi:MAG: hypothetical protein ACO3TI_06155 [Aquiluna sp.]
MDTSWLSSLFGSGEGAAAGSSGGASWIGPLISALGSVASKTKWTPRRDATQEDIDKANRNNMLMALLGAGAEAYGNYQQQEAMGSLSDVFAKGGMTTTAPGLPGTEPKQLGLAESIFEWGKQNPQFAAKALELGSAAQQQDKENRIAAAKALGKGPGNWGLTQDYQAARIGEALRMSPAANLAQMQEQREAFETQAKAQEDQRRAILGDLLGTVTPGRPMTSVAPQTQPATASTATPSILPPADMGQFIQGLAKATKAGQDFNVTVAPGANMDAAARALEQEGLKDWGYTEPPTSDAAPFLAGPQATATPTPRAMTAMQRGVAEAEQKLQQEADRQREERELREAQAAQGFREQEKKPFDAITTGATMAKKVAKDVNGLLAQNNRFATAQALTLVKKSLDNSVLQSGEYKTAESQLETWRNRIERGLLSIQGDQMDFSPEARESIRQVANMLAKSGLSSASEATKLIEQLVKARKDNKPINIFEEQLQEFKRLEIGDLGSKIDSITQSIQGLTPSAAPTPIGSPQASPMSSRLGTPTTMPTPEMMQYQGKSYIVRRRF